MAETISINGRASGEAEFVRGSRVKKIAFDWTSRLTGGFPRMGAAVLDSIVNILIGNPILAAAVHRRNQRTVSRIRSFQRFLVIPDIHIGDAVMTQAALTALRDFFPEAHIDYVVNRSAAPMIAGNPEATRVLPLFSNGFFISRDDLRALRNLARRGNYDLCLNYCPFIKDKFIVADGQRILNIMTLAPLILRSEWDSAQINHFLFHHYWFVRELLSPFVPLRRHDRFRGVRLTLPASARDRAQKFAGEAGLVPGRPTILINPDGASPYTRIPFESHASLLKQLAELNAAILLNSGHTITGIGDRLRATLPPDLRPRVGIIPPDIPLEVYAAIVDLCDVFISGDTGPLHIAAARRFPENGDSPYRNRTAVISCFGGTPARMSGYDAFQKGFLPANQDAPSWNFTAGSPCRNITCLNKLQKTCDPPRCFEDLDIAGLVERVKTHLAALPAQTTPQLSLSPEKGHISH